MNGNLRAELIQEQMPTYSESEVREALAVLLEAHGLDWHRFIELGEADELADVDPDLDFAFKALVPSLGNSQERAETQLIPYNQHVNVAFDQDPGKLRAELTNLRAELIQVAAVAVAIVEQIDIGWASAGYSIEAILDDIYEERMRQYNKWGPQSHELEIWAAILLEEVGEAIAEIPYKPDNPWDKGPAARWTWKMVNDAIELEQTARQVLHWTFDDPEVDPAMLAPSHIEPRKE